MEKDKSLVNNAMFYGLIFGVIMVIYSFLTQKIALGGGGMSQQMLLGGISILLYFVGVVVSTIHFRKSKLDNQITYRQSLVFGILVVFFSSFLVAVYTFVYTNWINPDYLQDVYEVGRQTALDMYERLNLPEEAIEQALDAIEEQGVSTPSQAALANVWAGLLIGTIVSLITSIFTKKVNNDPFSTMESEEAES